MKKGNGKQDAIITRKSPKIILMKIVSFVYRIDYSCLEVVLKNK